MVILLATLRGTDVDVAEAERRIQKGSNGWARVGQGVWMFNTTVRPSDWRDHLRTKGLEVFVVQVQGNWACNGYDDIADWMKRAKDVI